eukprot:5645859-Alexandrium_andersonii.AAC.1
MGKQTPALIPDGHNGIARRNDLSSRVARSSRRKAPGASGTPARQVGERTRPALGGPTVTRS